MRRFVQNVGQEGSKVCVPECYSRDLCYKWIVLTILLILTLAPEHQRAEEEGSC